MKLHRHVSCPHSHPLRRGRQAGGRAGRRGITWPSRLGPGQWQLHAMAARCPLPTLAQPGSVQLGSVQLAASQSLPELPCCSRAKPLHSPMGLPGSASTHRALNKAKGLRTGQKNRGKDPSEAGSGDLVTLAQPVLLREQCQPERKRQLPVIALFGNKGKIQSSHC